MGGFLVLEGKFIVIKSFTNMNILQIQEKPQNLLILHAHKQFHSSILHMSMSETIAC